MFKRVTKVSNKKGFTLIELCISLTVTAILLVMIITVIVNIINTSKTVTKQNSYYTDLQLTEMYIRTYFNDFAGYEQDGVNYGFTTALPSVVGTGKYTASSQQTEYLAVYTKGSDISGEFAPFAVLSFDKQSRSIVSSNSYRKLRVATVDDILFYRKGDALRVLVYYGGSYHPLIIMLSCREVD